MRDIFINLKRFDVPRSMGGVCDSNNPAEWAGFIIDECVKLGLGSYNDMRVTFLMPEAMLIPALQRLQAHSSESTQSLAVGCQGVFREDISPGGNFGAFTTNLPATAAKNLGCTWSIIGHSEERKDKLGLLSRVEAEPEKAKAAVDGVINEEVLAALRAGINVLVCIGETSEEKGEGSAAEQEERVRRVLKAQLTRGLKGVSGLLADRSIVIGYEPVWAIGPGKTPPGAEYMSFVSAYVKEVVQDELGFTPLVVYGGGLKEENAGMVASVETLDGGLVALTRFSGEIGFRPDELKGIVDKYREALGM